MNKEVEDLFDRKRFSRVILVFNLEVGSLKYVSPDAFLVENVKRENAKTLSGG